MAEKKFDYKVRDGFHFGKNKQFTGGDTVKLTEAEAKPCLDKLVLASDYLTSGSAAKEATDKLRKEASDAKSAQKVAEKARKVAEKSLKASEAALADALEKAK